jgi:16S rRNA U516 pseudouridylate synthase RsuA-like enzyme
MFPARIVCVVKLIDGTVAIVIVYAIAGLRAENNGSEARVRVDRSRFRADDPVSFSLRHKPAGVVVADVETVGYPVIFRDIPDRGPGMLVSKVLLEASEE